MDDLPGLFAQDSGFRQQDKSAPMAAASKTTGNIGRGGTLNFGFGSGADSRYSSNKPKSNRNSNSMSGSILDDHDGLFGSTTNTKTQDFGGLGGYSDVFGGPPKYSNQSDVRGGSSSFDYDSIFQGSNDLGSRSSTLPVYDKPVYDDDIFDGIPGLKSSSSVKYDGVFSSISLPPKQSAPFDDLLGNFGKTEPEPKFSSRNKSSEVNKGVPADDDLIPGFGGSSPQEDRATSEVSPPHQSTFPSAKSSSSMMEDPFVDFGTTSTSTYSSSRLFTDPLEQISELGNFGSTKVDGSSISGRVFDDLDPFGGLGKSVPSFSSDTNDRRKDGSPLRAAHTSAGQESTEEPSAKPFDNQKVPVEKFQESHQSLFDMPTVSSDSHISVSKNGSRPSYVNSNEINSQVGISPRSEENFEAADDVWLTVSEIPLFTQPTNAPPPSRPPPRPTQASKVGRGYSGVIKKAKEFSSIPNSTQNTQSPKAVPDIVKSFGVSSIDELEDFATGRTQNHADENVDVLSSEDEAETNSVAAASAAAMKEAMDRAEAKFKHAKEVRGRENAKAYKSREASQQEKDENAMQDAQERKLREKQEILDREWNQREREEKEREQRRLEKEKEREKAREIERGKGRQAVERATREARERAATEARLKAERAAVERANAVARERAERAAVQRVQAEARERAAAEARERAERVAAEARERANAEEREKEARERAVVAAEARLRVERAAVERAAAEARERAAAAAKENQRKNERAAAAARESQPKNENDLEGESEERRRARLERHSRTQERAEKALDEKNQRDLQVQRDQAERHRIGETLDVEIKRWAAGKESNLRALLSTMQYVLWPESGWQPVSLTDLITPASVKKVYRKATLCIHPDKVQQKGANLQQKYIAEKVFDLLKEAWNKFNSEELF